ncbi:MAG TPA: hypothetical protein EYQ83_14175 [Acidobacteria bacterium]|nr:hypothetical protein [Acidobacteriota bacterium]
MRFRNPVVLGGLAALWLGSPAAAQERITFNVDVTFYGDNTEFFNPWREGETLLGAESRLFLDVELNDFVTLRGGIFGDHRFGDDDNFETVRPVLALHLQNDYARFVIGSIESGAREVGLGPDQQGPHGLLPPLQRESLAFSRPDEAGLQLTVERPRFEQETWINWQQLNTEMNRETFDAGLRGRLHLGTPLPVWFSYQYHVVHSGGQLFDSGPVGDSWAGGPGFIVELPAGPFDAQTAEVHGLVARDVPDRAALSHTETGFGFGLFARYAAEKSGWRAHLIGWRARDFIKGEGDENYGSLREDGRLASLRHYFETGVSRTYHPANEMGIEFAARMHRIDTFHDYSFRILAKVDFGIPIKVPGRP